MISTGTYSSDAIMTVSHSASTMIVIRTTSISIPCYHRFLLDHYDLCKEYNITMSSVIMATMLVVMTTVTVMN